MCLSTAPPLLLSIFGSCGDCGGRRSVIAEDHLAGKCAQCVSVAGGALDAYGGGHKCSPPTSPRSGIVRVPSELLPLPGDSCGHSRGTRYSITALCQSCHANRVMEVA